MIKTRHLMFLGLASLFLGACAQREVMVEVPATSAAAATTTTTTTTATVEPSPAP